MVKFTDDMLSTLRSTAPRTYDDTIPAHYSKLSDARRVAVRARYVEEQQGRCWHCGGMLVLSPPPHILAHKINWHLFPGRDAGFLKHPVHLHHDHNTDLTLGAVHAYCNAVLWQYHGE